jgi:anti-anti-sigma factor
LVAFTDWEVAVRSMAVCRVTVEPLEDACVIRATGELDWSSAEHLRAPLEAARAEGTTTLVDLAGVTFMDSAALRVLLVAARDTGADEWSWFIVRPSLAVVRLIAVSGVAAQLPLVAPVDRVPQRGRAPVVPLRGRRRPGAQPVAGP